MLALNQTAAVTVRAARAPAQRLRRVAAFARPKASLRKAAPTRPATILNGRSAQSVTASHLTSRHSIACAAAAQEGSVAAPELDVEAIARYFGATVLELGLMCLTMFGVQSLILPNISGDIGKGLVFVMYLFLSVKSRIFNVLGARRPSVKEEDRAKEENRRPSWMPPPKVFPIVWISIAFLRAISSVLVWEASGRDLLALPLVAFLLHLSIGDTWNHITNVKKQLGVSFSGTAFVWGSVATVVTLYYGVSQQAGLVLAPSWVWLTIASYLVYSIWRLNSPEKHPLYPPKM